MCKYVSFYYIKHFKKMVIYQGSNNHVQEEVESQIIPSAIILKKETRASHIMLVWYKKNPKHQYALHFLFTFCTGSLDSSSRG
jgi:hypothetical protein